MLEHDSEQFKNYLRWYQRPAIAAAIALLSLFIASVAASYILAKQAAEDEALKQAHIWSNSASILVAPLILSKDLVSLNFVTNQIADDPFVAGIQITDTQKMRLAAAGEQTGIRASQPIAPNSETIADLEVWIDSTLVQRQLNYQAALISGGAILAFLLSTFIYRRQSKLLEEEVVYIQQIEDSFDDSELLDEAIDDPEHETASETLQEDSHDHQEIKTSEEDTHDHSEINTSEEDMIVTNDHDSSYAAVARPETDELSPLILEVDEHSDPTVKSISEIDIKDSELQPDTTASDKIEHELGIDHIDTEETGEQDNPLWPDAPEPPIVKMQIDEHSDIVDLLKPESRTDKTPPFKPSTYVSGAVDPLMDTLENEIPERHFQSNTQPLKKKAHRLPIINEEQLDLYTIEQELDLLIPGKDAGYLVLIDFTSPHSSPMPRESVQQIKRTYRTLANSVANIYDGEIEPLGEDIQIHFQTPHDRDEHGVNATCAAILFTQLVRAYNTSREAQSQPVLNIHTAIVRGHLGKQERMADEARFLTRSTQGHHLISHTALSEAPDLKETALSGADIRREDEDKVLIMSLAKSYQELLEKQARYLMAKLAQKAQ